MDDMTHELGGMIGHPDIAAHFEQAQHAPLDCEEAAVADVINEVIGTHLTDEQIAHEALHTHSAVPVDPQTHQPHPYVYEPAKGTFLVDAPKLLAAHGVHAVYTNDDLAHADHGPATGIDALRHQLQAGHHVLTSVDAEKIWNSIGLLPGHIDPGHSDHVVEVTGIDDKYVYLNDTGNEDPAHPHAGAGERVDIEVFKDAWALSHHEMVTTTSGHQAGIHSDPLRVPGPTLPMASADPFAPQHVDPAEAAGETFRDAAGYGLAGAALGAGAAGIRLAVRRTMAQIRDRRAAAQTDEQTDTTAE